ncbi:hypothetical protein EVAR_67749_1 [Eumeta japonica]|uniref:Uncharacterized protein n=1 Tax=Eumeta variegata TaxID=151549 RepID=A0A4C1ZEM1_EUMVA|nr:hypothetical protein EVAR_67749_1 [Eumeta japonica]
MKKLFYKCKELATQGVRDVRRGPKESPKSRYTFSWNAHNFLNFKYKVVLQILSETRSCAAGKGNGALSRKRGISVSYFLRGTKSSGGAGGAGGAGRARGRRR